MKWSEKRKLSRELIELFAKLKASDIKQNIGKGIEEGEDEPLDEMIDCDFTQIQNMEIPEKFTYEFWRYMNMIGDYWAYRYDFELPTKSHLSKYNIRLAIATARLYGLGGVDKTTGIPYSISVRDGKYIGVPVSAMLDDKNYMKYDSNSKTYSADLQKYETKEFKREEIALLRCRRTGIGDFVWFMIPVLEYIQADKILKVNLSMLKNILFYQIYDKENANNEIKQMLDTFKPIIRVVGSKKFKADNLGSFNNVKQESFSKETHIEKIISVAKYEFENMLYFMGIPQTSAKNQSLSSDLNLSVSTANIFAKCFDEPVEEFLDELGIKNVEIPDTQVQVANQNADKFGAGKENTEGEINETKAQRSE